MTIIQGDPNYLVQTLNPILEGLGIFLGNRYHSLVFDTISQLYFYEQDEHQTLKEVLEELTGKIISKREYEETIGQEDDTAFYFLNLPNQEEQDQFILYRKSSLEKRQKSFAHALAHAICGYVDPLVIEDKELYVRNGISIENQYQEKHRIASEGFIEMISYGILEKMGVPLTPDMIHLPYMVAYGNAKFIYDELGAQKVMDCLLLNQGNIIDKFNAYTNDYYFEKLERLSRINAMEMGENVNKRWQETEPIHVQYLKKKYQI